MKKDTDDRTAGAGRTRKRTRKDQTGKRMDIKAPRRSTKTKNGWGRDGMCRLGKKFQLAPMPVVRRCADDGNDDVKRNLETG